MSSSSSAVGAAATAGPFAPSVGRPLPHHNASLELLQKLLGDENTKVMAPQPGRASAYQTGQPQPGGRLRARSIGKPATGASTPSVMADDEPRPSSPAYGVAPFDLASSTAGFPRPSLNAQGRSKSIGGDTLTGSTALSALARQRADSEARRVKFSDRAYEYAAKATAFGRGGGAGGEASSSTEGTGTEESGSTQSDSPPHTPREYHLAAEGASGSDEDGEEGQHAGGGYWVVPPSRRGSTAVKEEREAWRTGGEPDLHYNPYDPAHLTRSAELPLKALPPTELYDQDEPAATPVDSSANRNRSKSLEGLTRMSLRRGKSFTSLLVQPVTPSPAAAERRDPFLCGAADRAKLSAIAPTPVLAQFENPPMSDGAAATLYPPATGEAIATRKSLRDFVPQLAILLTLFLSSFVVIALTIATLPGLFLPHSVSDLPALTKTLTTYRASSFTAELHLFFVLTLLFLWKQCFSIPGSILTNILFGALYGTTLGTWWACLWTATGSTGAYLIAVVIAPLVEYYFAKPLDVTRRALKLSPPVPAASTAPGIAQASVAPPTDSDLFSHLLLARFFPLLPYSVLNVIAGVLRLPLGPFFSTLLIGSFPFNFATVSIGNLVALAAADPSKPLGDKIWSREVVLKLVAVTFISVVPLAFKDRLRTMLSNGGTISLLIDRARNHVSRALFGFSAVPSSSIMASTASIAAQPSHRSSSSLGSGPSSAGPSNSAPSGGAGGPRAWKRKISRSIGNAADLLMLGIRGKNLDASAGGYAYERIANGAGESATGVLDNVEMGGIDPSRTRT